MSVWGVPKLLSKFEVKEKKSEKSAPSSILPPWWPERAVGARRGEANGKGASLSFLFPSLAPGGDSLQEFTRIDCKDQ